MTQGPLRVGVHPRKDLRIPRGPEVVLGDAAFGPVAVEEAGAGVEGQGRDLHIVGLHLPDEGGALLHIGPGLAGDARDEIDAQVQAHLAHQLQGAAGLLHVGALVEKGQHPFAGVLHAELHELAARALHGHQALLVHEVHPALAVPEGMQAAGLDAGHQVQDAGAVGGEGVIPEAHVGEPVALPQQAHLLHHRGGAAEADGTAPELGRVAEVAGGGAAPAGAQVGQLAHVIEEIRLQVRRRDADGIEVLQGRRRGGFAFPQDQAWGMAPEFGRHGDALQDPQQGAFALALHDGIQRRAFLEDLRRQVCGVGPARQQHGVGTGLPGPGEQLEAAPPVEGEHGNTDDGGSLGAEVGEHLLSRLAAQVGQAAGEARLLEGRLEVAQADGEEAHPLVAEAAAGCAVHEHGGGAQGASWRRRMPWMSRGKKGPGRSPST
ncbi:MAG: hypothetical protein BWY56_01528 [Acidobacteria bacterium ADurb.Bin340]|nr:MAG: hypothetical protein BWY56_01528 [Acidobacteria bacterium ADurb.Bin340]